MVRPMLGIAGKAVIKAKYQGVPIITQRRKERKIREHNTDMTETRAARVEQNTRREAEPSTLYQVYRCIKITWQYNDIPRSKINVPTRNGLQSSPANSNAIRGAEQSGNIANQRFARTMVG